ncbi:MAG: type II secretion system GspH family protein [Pseudanabaena sp. CAN_BIN31]|nr:type II secretion system GspH family protein [Pseudanabaena sp. CAN_BIN31]
MKAKTNFKFAMLLSLRARQQHGFTLIEVIVAIVILSIFTLTALTALVAGLNLKLKAKLNNEATLLIQQDLELVRYTATQLGIETVTTVPTAPANGIGATISGTTNLNLTILIADNNQGFPTTATTGSQLTIGGETTAYTLTTIPTSNATSLAVTVNLSKIYRRFSTISGSPLTLSTSSPISSITVADASAFQSGDRIVIGPASGVIFSAIVSSINTTTSPNTVSFASLTPSTAQSYAVGTRVTALPRVGDVIPNTALCTNIATSSIDSLKNIAILGATSIVVTTTTTPSPLEVATASTVIFNQEEKPKREYRLTRKTTAASTTTLQMVYGVRDTVFSTGTDLATLTTEVIPSVTFQCP